IFTRALSPTDVINNRLRLRSWPIASVDLGLKMWGDALQACMKAGIVNNIVFYQSTRKLS
ncbi:MAG: hypothetical protein WCF72_18545, partial [Pseudolabrys sp.]